MSLTPGTRIGSYEIAAQIGAGGMGEVYRARDTRLDRAVAIKILPESFAHDPERLARFEREAKTLAALNHPNIAIIHGFEDATGIKALVMELVEGLTLADWIAQGPIPLDEALPIAKQIAEALEVAHEHGIIHRDLKPANIKVRPDGTVKVLDFGLAKALAGDAAISPAALTNSPTITSPVGVTGVGVLLGTAAYMSPEQAKGRAVDKRSDVWAFGCVLYEMLTGRRAFAGEDVPETIGAVIHKEPDWTALPAATPPAIRTLLRRCLQKDRRQRIPDVGVARIEIQDVIAAGPAGVSPPRAATRYRERLAWAVAAVACAVAAGVAASSWLRPAAKPDAPAILASILPVEEAAMAGLPPSRFAISPDGRYLAFTAGPGPPRLWVRSLETDARQHLPGTEGAFAPFWSPDSQSLAFIAGGKLKTISVSGGPVNTLADANNTAGSWSPGDVIVFPNAIGSGLSRINAAGGPVTPATTLDTAAGDNRHWWPYFLPDGQHFLYEAVGGSAGMSDPRAVYVGSLDPGEKSRLVLNAGSNAKYAEGHILFMQGGTLMAQPFDVDRLELTGEATPVAERVEVGGLTGTSGAFSVSNAGVLVYQRTNGELGNQLVWFDRTGKQIAVVGERAEYLPPLELSPDGTQATVALRDRARDIWIVDLRRGLKTVFTRHERDEYATAWWPDGKRIVFNGGSGPVDLYVKAASGAGSEDVLFQDSMNKLPLSISHDGRFLIYGTGPAADLWVLRLTGDRKPIPYMQTPFQEGGGRFSRDGRWVAFGSDETGRTEMYVAPFPATDTKVLVSAAGALPLSARWREDGHELFYLSPEGTLMAAAVDGQGAEFRVSGVKELFPMPVALTRQSPDGRPTAAGPVYDVSADGQQVLVIARVDDRRPMPLTVVVNWHSGLEARESR